MAALHAPTRSAILRGAGGEVEEPKIHASKEISKSYNGVTFTY